MTTTEPILVSRPEAARLLGVSQATIKRLIRRGALEEVRLAPRMHPRIRVAGVTFRDEAAALERRLLGVESAGRKSAEAAPLREMA